jgi:deoxyribose-phosphate aldolase
MWSYHKFHTRSYLEIKASGSIKTDEFAKELIDLGAKRIGTSTKLF